jgi:hypothetical protein
MNVDVTLESNFILLLNHCDKCLLNDCINYCFFSSSSSSDIDLFRLEHNSNSKYWLSNVCITRGNQFNISTCKKIVQSLSLSTWEHYRSFEYDLKYCHFLLLSTLYAFFCHSLRLSWSISCGWLLLFLCHFYSHSNYVDYKSDTVLSCTSHGLS